MSRNISQKAVNFVREKTLEWMENFLNNASNSIVEPVHLDMLEERLFKQAKERLPAENIWRNFVRTEIVAAILGEYGVHAFGVKPVVERKVISDAAIKKYAKKK